MKHFPTALRAEVERLGTNESARICGVTTRTLQLWMNGDGNPNLATMAGAILLLSQAKRTKPKV